MANKKVTVLARFKAKKGLEKQAFEAIMACVPPTRAEYGCINYDLHVSPDDPTKLFLYENWISKELLDQHLATPWLTKLKGSAEQLFAEPIDITLWEKIP
jgi:quinol monooxygenase YgiN